jgi:Asp-tRNA(Asn)/Glu-tRNA(Gln) amidotransferase A subunit family amidase
VLDGWGYRDDTTANAVALAETPNWDGLMGSVPHTLLEASGRRVGLPVGQMGNSEVGHMNLGAGRVVEQDLVRIGAAIETGSFFANPALVAACRDAGMVVLGKTVTTEFATFQPGVTRNPRAPADAPRTPGGSSSGSAAAVAAGMVPLAVGTQTNGSVIRPAAFCGVFGFKPSAGVIARTGVLRQSPALDSVGVFGRTLDDVALLAEALAGHDAEDPKSLLRAAPPLLRMARAEPPLPPTLAWVQTPFWNRVAPDAHAAFSELLELLAGRVAPFELPAAAADAIGWHRTVMEADIAGSFVIEYDRGREQLSASLRDQIERGRGVSAVDYRQALDRVPYLLAAFDNLFEHFDAILTPATLGTAPEGLASTGDPLMCTLWTFLGMPALSLPLLHGENGLPLGVQLVGRRGDDARLLRTARWLVQTVQAAQAAP